METLHVREVANRKGRNRFRETRSSRKTPRPRPVQRRRLRRRKLMAHSDEHIASTETKLKEQREVWRQDAENAVNTRESKSLRGKSRSLLTK